MTYVPGTDSIASAGSDGTVRLWNPSQGENRILHRHPGGALGIATSRNGRFIASRSRDFVCFGIPLDKPRKNFDRVKHRFTRSSSLQTRPTSRCSHDRVARLESRVRPATGISAASTSGVYSGFLPERGASRLGRLRCECRGLQHCNRPDDHFAGTRWDGEKRGLRSPRKVSRIRRRGFHRSDLGIELRAGANSARSSQYRPIHRILPRWQTAGLLRERTRTSGSGQSTRKPTPQTGSRIFANG